MTTELDAMIAFAQGRDFFPGRDYGSFVGFCTNYLLEVGANPDAPAGTAKALISFGKDYTISRGIKLNDSGTNQGTGKADNSSEHISTATDV